MTTRLLAVHVHHEQDIVGARRRARQIAAALGFDSLEQTRIATAVSELARNACHHANGGVVEYFLEGNRPPQVFSIVVSDRGPGIPDVPAVLSGQLRSQTGLGLGLVGARQLMDTFDLVSSEAGTTVTIKKILPVRARLLTASDLNTLAVRLAKAPPESPVEEVQQQNQELLRALDELRARQQELERVNRELEDTNRGVVALYAELDERADHLRRADELKTRFLSNMTHEFRTPVNSILALTNLLAERLGTPPDRKDELFYIRKSAEQLSDIVDDLLDIAKVEAGKIDVHPATFEVSSLFSALRGMLRPLLLNPSVSLIFDSVDDLPPLLSDESKVSQILRNFIPNALKYTEQGEVRVSARLTPDRSGMVFSVADTGIGIPPGDLDRVFDEFVQIENPLQRRVKGTGLGLPLSRRLAELLGGSISVESTFGEGSTFSLTLPLLYRTGTPTPLGPIEPGRVPVLVIEDADEDLLIYERIFTGTRFQPLPAPSAEAALAVLETVRPGAILFDVRLQGYEAWDLLARFKREARTASIPLIVVSTIDDAGKGIALGADAYAVKPVDREWLMSHLEALVPARSTIRVLSVDDEETFRFIVRGMLPPPEFEVAEAATGPEALRMAEEFRPDIILLDVRLGEESGTDIMRRLQQASATAHIPVILVTSLTSDAESSQGAAAVLQKAGLAGEHLREAVRAAALEARKVRKEVES